MWSRKKRRKEGKSDSGNVPTSAKGKQSERQQLQQQSSRPASISPAVVRKEPRVAATEESSVVDTGAVDDPTSQCPLPDFGSDAHLAVPLPSSPLSANILESLNGSTGGGGGGGGGGASLVIPALQQSATAASTVVPSSADSVSKTAEQLKQVIEEAQRTLISQITQQLAGSVAAGVATHTPTLPSVPIISGRMTQTFDYGNQSNKELEQAAVEQLEQDYQARELDRWT